MIEVTVEDVVVRAPKAHPGTRPASGCSPPAGSWRGWKRSTTRPSPRDGPSRSRWRREARALSLAYGEVVALQDVSAEVDGRVIGVLGATASGNHFRPRYPLACPVPAGRRETRMTEAGRARRFEQALAEAGTR